MILARQRRFRAVLKYAMIMVMSGILMLLCLQAIDATPVTSLL